MHTENSGDAIRIEQLEVFAHIGVPEDERAHPQRLRRSATLACPDALKFMTRSNESSA